MSATARTQLSGPGALGPKVFTAAAAPTADNDIADGALVGDLWVIPGTATNAVQKLLFVDSTGSGNFTLTCEGITTGNITYSATPATLVGNINTALDLVFGTAQLVASGATLAAIIVTFSGSNYTHRPVGVITANVGGLSGATLTISTTTAGVAGSVVYFCSDATAAAAVWGKVAHVTGATLTALVDSTGGTPAATLAALAALSTSNTYSDAAVNAKLAIIANSLSSLCAKQNAIIAVLKGNGVAV